MEKRSHDGPNTTSNNHISRKRAGLRDDPKPPPDLILPEPTFPVLDQNKKSHAKKQPAGHIPRPRNAFILFRCDFVRQKKIPASVEKDHRNISRIIGKIWQQMSAEQKEPWKQMAEQEKINHHEIYPNYKFSVGPSTKKKSKRGDSDTPIKEEPQMKMEDVHVFLGRASSCPPGAEVVSQAVFDSEAPQYGDPLRTRDDLSRRPSSTVYYRSTPYDLTAEMQQPGFFSSPVNQRYFVQALANNDSFPRPPGEESTHSETREGAAVGRFCGPRLVDELQLRYPIPGRMTPPEWETPLMSLISSELYQRSDLDDDHPIPDFLYSDSSFATLPPLPRTISRELALNSVATLHSSSYHTSQTQSIAGSSYGQDAMDLVFIKPDGKYDDTILDLARDIQMAPAKDKDEP